MIAQRELLSRKLALLEQSRKEMDVPEELPREGIRQLINATQTSFYKESQWGKEKFEKQL